MKIIFIMVFSGSLLSIFGKDAKDQQRLCDELFYSIETALEAPRVVGIFPRISQITENHLKFYIEFSKPMAQDLVYVTESIEIEGPEGNIKDAFQEAELWNEKRTRLTLIVHPGRQKTGIVWNEKWGRIFKEGENYTLRIHPGLYSEDGVLLEKTFEHTFTVTELRRSQIDPREWQIHVPLLHQRDPLKLVFPYPLDHVLLQDMITIQDSQSKQVEGEVSVQPSGLCWSFSPKNPWTMETYHVKIDPQLEDSCGNTLLRPFEMSDSDSLKYVPIERQFRPEHVRSPMKN